MSRTFGPLSEARIIGEQSFIVEAVCEMDFNGQWEDAGYRVTTKGASHMFVGYPTNDDIMKWWNEKGGK